MNKINKALIAIFLLFSTAPSFAEYIPPTSNQVVSCSKLKAIASTHDKLSIAVKQLVANPQRLPTTPRFNMSKAALDKIYDDINEIRKLGGITKEVDLLDKTDTLLSKVESGTYSKDKASELMLEKLPELDDEMFATIRKANDRLPGCDAVERRARSTDDSDSDSESDSDLVQ